MQCTALPVSCDRKMEKEKEKKVDYGGVFGALLIDWPKAFNCIPHDLFIVKVGAYGFQTDAVNLVYDYFSNRRQKIKVNKTFSSWKDIVSGVPRGSTLGALLFNIHLCEYTSFLLPWRSRYCKLCGWHENTYS